MSKAKALQPKFNVGEVVNYTDRQGRRQSGKVRHIVGQWTAFGSVYLIYTVQHPSYRNGQMHCGEDVIEGGNANKSLNYDPADPDKMRLPKGSSCGNCHHILRCKAIFGHTETDTYCDWSPSRFIPVRAEGDAK